MKAPHEYLRTIKRSDNADIEKLLADYTVLYNAVRKHMEQSGHDLCWENDLELWKNIDPNVKYPHETLPAEETFEAECKRYYKSRLP